MSAMIRKGVAVDFRPPPLWFPSLLSKACFKVPRRPRDQDMSKPPPRPPLRLRRGRQLKIQCFVPLDLGLIEHDFLV